MESNKTRRTSEKKRRRKKKEGNNHGCCLGPLLCANPGVPELEKNMSLSLV